MRQVACRARNSSAPHPDLSVPNPPSALNRVLISIIIPAFNEERLLGATLAGVQTASRAFTARGWQAECIVCDNNSTDRTAELARAAGARVVFEPINQIARARNCGAAAARGDWLIFIDADSIPTPELFDDVANQIESGRCLAGGATIRLDSRSLAGRAVTGFWNGLSRTFLLLAGSFIFCEASAFREIGGFSSELFAGEELELSERLKKLARRRDRKLVILHRHPLLTSARKLDLYTAGELVGFFFKAAVRRQQVLTNRGACQPWYDGRR